VKLEDNLSGGTTFVSISIPSGWACTTPQVGAAGLISCNAVSLASGATATFTVVLNIGCAVSNASVINNTATVRSATPDPALANNASTAGVSVSNTPPKVTAAVATASPWPPDSSLINVGLSATTSDGACPAPAVSSVQVWGDEDDQTPTSGSEVFSPDAKDFGLGTLRLRAERVDSLDGRVYLIVVRATDTGGATGFGTATVVVPVNASPSASSSVAAQAASAKAYAEANNGNPPPGYFVIGDGPTIGNKQ